MPPHELRLYIPAGVSDISFWQRISCVVCLSSYRVAVEIYKPLVGRRSPKDEGGLPGVYEDHVKTYRVAVEEHLFNRSAVETSKTVYHG